MITMSRPFAQACAIASKATAARVRIPGGPVTISHVGARSAQRAGCSLAAARNVFGGAEQDRPP